MPTYLVVCWPIGMARAIATFLLWRWSGMGAMVYKLLPALLVSLSLLVIHHWIVTV